MLSASEMLALERVKDTSDSLPLGVTMATLEPDKD